MALGKEKRVECQGAGRGRFFSFPPAVNPLCSPGLGDLVSGGEASDAQSQAITLIAKIGKARPTVRGGGRGGTRLAKATEREVAESGLTCRFPGLRLRGHLACRWL